MLRRRIKRTLGIYFHVAIIYNVFIDISLKKKVIVSINPLYRHNVHLANRLQVLAKHI